MASLVIIGFLTILANVLLRQTGSQVSSLSLRCRTTPSLEMYSRWGGGGDPDWTTSNLGIRPATANSYTGSVAATLSIGSCAMSASVTDVASFCPQDGQCV